MNCLILVLLLCCCQNGGVSRTARPEHCCGNTGTNNSNSGCRTDARNESRNFFSFPGSTCGCSCEETSNNCEC